MKTLKQYYKELDPNRAGYIECAIAGYIELDKIARTVCGGSAGYWNKFVAIPAINSALRKEHVTRREIILCAKQTYRLTNGNIRDILSLIFE